MRYSSPSALRTNFPCAWASSQIFRSLAYYLDVIRNSLWSGKARRCLSFCFWFSICQQFEQSTSRLDFCVIECRWLRNTSQSAEFLRIMVLLVNSRMILDIC